MDQQELHIPLFPYSAKWIGLACIAAGLIFGYLYFLGGRPSFFNVKVFAIVTAYMETRYFVISQTNLLDELFSILCIGGICLVVLSKEKKEYPGLHPVRFRSLVYAVYATTAVWVFIYLFFYGWITLWILTFGFPAYLLTYYAVFRLLVIRRKSKLPGEPYERHRTIDKNEMS